MSRGTHDYQRISMQTRATTRRAGQEPGPVIHIAPTEAHMTNLNLSKLSIDELSQVILACTVELHARAKQTTIAAVDQQPVPVVKPVTASPKVLKPVEKAPQQAVPATGTKGPHRLNADELAAGRAKGLAVIAAKRAAAKASKPAAQPKAATPGFKVRKPDGSLCGKRFESAALASAWLSSWVNKAHAAKYGVVAA